jgi:hypothetical protein
MGYGVMDDFGKFVGMIPTDEGDESGDPCGGGFGLEPVFGGGFDGVFPSINAMNRCELHTGRKTGFDQTPGEDLSLAGIGEGGHNDLTLYFAFHSVL